MKKLFATLAVSAMIVAGVATHARAQAASQSPATPATPQAQSSQSQSQAARSATGKITAVSGNTFSIEVGNGDTKQTMQFMTDSTTAKSGDLKVGSTATVEYRPGADGKNTATKVNVQG